MASPQQIEANRRNALRSTGARTEEGKAAVRLNAVTNGLRARTLIIPGEDPREFETLCRELVADHQPLGRTEEVIVEQLAEVQWRLARVNRAEQRLFRKRAWEYQHTPHFNRYREAMEKRPAEDQIPLADDLLAETFEGNRATLEDYSRQRDRLDRSWSRALRELQRLQDRRACCDTTAAEPPQPEASPSQEIAAAPNPQADLPTPPDAEPDVAAAPDSPVSPSRQVSPCREAVPAAAAAIARPAPSHDSQEAVAVSADTSSPVRSNSMLTS